MPATRSASRPPITRWPRRRAAKCTETPCRTFTAVSARRCASTASISRSASPAGTSTGNNYHHDLLNSWTPENSGSNIPRFAYNDSNQAAVSDRFLTSASYLNIQNITLGYTLPKRITRKFLVENLRIYLACDNVWYWSKRQGLDPRQSINGITNPYYYAPIRTFSGGVTVTF